MDFVTYVSILENRKLFFRRSDKFDDKYEGSTPQANIDKYKGAFSKIYKLAVETRKWQKKWIYINCWHMNDYESAAMWKLYGRNEASIAIQSTYARLKKDLLQGEFSKNIHFGFVNYIDYKKDCIPDDNLLWPLFHKRRSFEHERELRVLIDESDKNHYLIVGKKSNPKEGVYVQVDVEQLATAIYVSPTSPPWFFNLVDKVTSTYGYNIKILQSSLSTDPVY